MARSDSSSALRNELERAIRSGQCAYCRRAGSAENPLTREHVIPRAKGGGRKDVRIIVPACARCNHRRGCRELVPFLLLRPRRISAFLDYLGSLSPESVRQLDLRVFAELYTAIWILSESAHHGADWRAHLRRMSSGRTLHRRRYAARRMVGAVGGRLESLRVRDDHRGEPALPATQPASAVPHESEPMDQLNARLLALLSLAWQTSADEIRRQISLHHQQSGAAPDRDDGDGVVRLDGWRRRHHRRLRVDRRGGRRPSRRGRAAERAPGPPSTPATPRWPGCSAFAPRAANLQNRKVLTARRLMFYRENDSRQNKLKRAGAMGLDMYGHEARRAGLGAATAGGGGPVAAEPARRPWDGAGPGAEEAALVCRLYAADGSTLGTLSVDVGPLERDGGEESAALLRQGAVMLAEAIQANAASAPPMRWEGRGKAQWVGELAIRAMLVVDGTLVEEREFRLPANGTQVVPSPRVPLSDLVASYERRLIEDALRTTGGNRARAARILQTTERILGYRIQQYGIDCARYRRRNDER